MIRPLRFLDEYLLGSETRKWYMGQISTAREFVLDSEKLKNYIQETEKEIYFFLGFGRIFPNMTLGYAASKILSGEANFFDISLAHIGELIRLGITASQRLDRVHVREHNLSRTIEEETADHEPLVANEDDFEI